MADIDHLATHTGLMITVKEQGKLPISWALALSYAVSANHGKQHGNGVIKLLSTRELVNCVFMKYHPRIDASYESLISNAFRYVINYGLSYESDYAYQGKRNWSPDKPDGSKERVYLNTCRHLGSPKVPTCKRQILYSLGSHFLIGNLRVGPAFRQYESGVYTEANNVGHRVNHSVVIYGYSAEDDAFKVVNQYGAEWGIQNAKGKRDGRGLISVDLFNEVILPMYPHTQPWEQLQVEKLQVETES